VTEPIAPLGVGAPADASALAERVVANLSSAIHATPETLRLPLLCLLSEGHVLVEDVPGVGKTVLAKALARSLELRFQRVQFTPDLLPADVTGVNVFDRPSGSFRFRPDRCSPTSCSSTRSTAPPRRRSPRCSRRCRRRR
jgi:MoxR-like ATPase